MLEGTIKLPAVGPVKKEYVVLGAGAVILFGVAYYRQKKAKQASAAANAGANTGIDPATGYPYGSAEDAAALANQNGYITPTPVPGAGQHDTTTFFSNAQWAQYAEDQLVGNGSVTDVGRLSAALGKYLTGQPSTTDQVTLIEMAIAYAGYPPVAGKNGYPPSINTNPGGGGDTKPPPDGKAPGAVTGLRGSSGPFTKPPGGGLAGNYIDISWDQTPGATGYHVMQASPYGHADHGVVSGTSFRDNGLAAPDTDHRMSVAAVNVSGQGPWSSIVVHTAGRFEGPRPPAQPF